MLLQSTYVNVKSKRQLKSYAGVDLEMYKVLYKSLQSIKADKQNRLSSRPDRLRQYSGGDKKALLTIDDKLLFILHYYKTYPTMDVMATQYEISRSSIWNYVHT